MTDKTIREFGGEETGASDKTINRGAEEKERLGGRRSFVKTALAIAPIILTIKSRSVWADGDGGPTPTMMSPTHWSHAPH